MGTSTKEALGRALKQMMMVKPISKITVKDLVGICNVNRQTFYYHFDDVYDLLEWVFEEDANMVLPKEVKFETWREDVMVFFDYLQDNRAFALNIYNSNSRNGMLKFLTERLKTCIHSFSVLVSDGRNIDRKDFEFIVELYPNAVVGLIAQWMDLGMPVPDEETKDRFIKVLDSSIENMLARFQINK